MLIYFLLILYILLLMLWDRSKFTFSSKERKHSRVLFFSMCAIYLICVLRASTVGRDLPGYEVAYAITSDVNWNDYGYIYFEKGYIFLMKICTQLGLSFQSFLIVLYGVIIVPIWFFIKENSKNVMMSVLIYVCYIIFEFDLTGLRQGAAISIVILALQALISENNYKYIKYVLLVLLASTLHRSALIAMLFLPLVIWVKSLFWYTVAIIIGGFISLIGRNYLFSYIGTLFGSESFSNSMDLHIGGNLVFMCGIVMIAMYTYVIQSTKYIDNLTRAKVDGDSKEIFMLKAFMFGIVLSLFFGESTAARSYMYFSIALMIIVPNICSKFEKKSRTLLECAFTMFFVVFFYYNSLKANNFDIVPYKFFWQI